MNTLKINKITLNNFLIFSTIIYIILPIIIFIVFWCKIYISIPLSILLLLFSKKIYYEINSLDVQIFDKKSIPYWIFVIIFGFIMIYYTGIGGFSYQYYDHWARNAIYYDLRKYDWPVIYDLSKQSEYIKNIVGESKVSLVYYFTWWLVPSLFSKLLFPNNEFLSNVLLFLHAYWGYLLIIYNLTKITNKTTIIIPIVFILFSGMDLIGIFTSSIINNFSINNLNSTIHNFLADSNIAFNLEEQIEDWDGAQFSSNITSLYNVFNQFIPIYIIMELFLQLKNNKYFIALLSLTFPFSPWSGIGVALYIIFATLNKEYEFIKSINLYNIIIPICIIIIFGLFYHGSSSSDLKLILNYKLLSFHGFIRFVNKVIFEFFIYYIIMKKYILKKKYSLITLVALILFIIINDTTGNINMRASFPALAILSIYFIDFCTQKMNFKNNKKETFILIIIILITSSSPIHEIYKSIRETKNNHTVFNPIISFGKINNPEENNEYIILIRRQFYNYDYENSLFNKFIGK